MTGHYDVIVIGAGTMGAATLYELARHGVNCLGLEQFGITHGNGSYHGESRLIRFAYKQGDFYVPLLLRARELWRALEERSGEKLFQTGGLSITAPGHESYLDAVYRSVKKYDIPHATLSGAEINRRFPAFRLPDDFIGVYDEWAGYLLSEKSVAALARAARDEGAFIREGEKVESWQADGASVTVRTGQGIYSADRLVIAAGSWFGKLVPEYAPFQKTIREPISWYRPARPENFMPDALPVFILSDGRGTDCYAVPICGLPGMKIGPDSMDEADPDRIDRAVSPADEAATRSWTDRYLDLAGAPCLQTLICMYTRTPDKAFILGLHPAHPNVILGHACSGHGFKFAPVIGEILADLAIDGATRHDISAHNPRRFMLQAG